MKRFWNFFTALILAIIFTLFLASVTRCYVLIIAIITIFLIFFYPKLRGIMGEFWVKQKLKELPTDKYLVLNDIMLKQNDKTYQIDHLIISQFGIFVIETKNYYGLILGDDHKDKWIQYLGKKKTYFLNPIYQNYSHIKALEDLLNLDINKFISIICFSNQTKLNIKTQSDVVQLEYLITCIKNHHNIVLGNDLEEIRDKIIELNITDIIERKKHVKNIRTRINDNKKKIDNMICPRCGGNLVVRIGKYGSFIGCSNYPKCKYVENN